MRGREKSKRETRRRYLFSRGARRRVVKEKVGAGTIISEHKQTVFLIFVARCRRWRSVTTALHSLCDPNCSRTTTLRRTVSVLCTVHCVDFTVVSTNIIVYQSSCDFRHSFSSSRFFTQLFTQTETLSLLARSLGAAGWGRLR